MKLFGQKTGMLLISFFNTFLQLWKGEEYIPVAKNKDTPSFWHYFS